MSNDNKMLIDAAHPEETRVVVLRDGRVEEFDFESAAKKLLRGNIYLAKVTRVEPSLQAAFIDYGGNRHGFLAFNEVHPDYYQIPVADRQALLAAEAAAAKAQRDADDDAATGRRRRPRTRNDRQRPHAPTADADNGDNGVIEIIDDIEDLDEPTTIEGGSIISGDDDTGNAPAFEEPEDRGIEEPSDRRMAANVEGLSPGEFVRASEALDVERAWQVDVATDAAAAGGPSVSHDTRHSAGHGPGQTRRLT